MSKRKTSTQDFLNLLDDEAPASQMAFTPPKKKRVRATQSIKKPSTKEKILAELIDLAKKRSPRITGLIEGVAKEIGRVRKKISDRQPGNPDQNSQRTFDGCGKKRTQAGRETHSNCKE